MIFLYFLYILRFFLPPAHYIYRFMFFENLLFLVFLYGLTSGVRSVGT